MAKKIISHFFSMLLALSLFVLLIVGILRITVCNKQYIISKLEEGKYFEKVYYEILDGFEEYVIQSGLENKDLEGICSIEEVEEDVIKVLDSIYENSELNVNSDRIVSNLDNRINEILKNNNRIPDAEENESIKRFEKAIGQVYTDNILFSKEYTKGATKLIQETQKICNIVLVVTAIVSFALVCEVIVINSKTKDGVLYLFNSQIAVRNVMYFTKIAYWYENKKYINIKCIIFWSHYFNN